MKEKSVIKQTPRCQHLPQNNTKIKIKMNRSSVILETQYGEAELKYSYNWVNDELTVTFNYKDFATFLETTRQPTLASMHLQIMIEIEDNEGNKHEVNLPIPAEIMNKTPAQLRAMQSARDQ